MFVKTKNPTSTVLNGLRQLFLFNIVKSQKSHLFQWKPENLRQWKHKNKSPALLKVIQYSTGKISKCY